MIYTCTITPSIDYTAYLPEFHTGALNRSEEVYYYPGGKGINVSRVLHRLGYKSIALGFAGGFTGNYLLDALNSEGITTDFIHIDEITRINVKIKSENESELNGPGPIVNIAEQNKLISKLQYLSKNDWFVLAGSLPNTLQDSFYQNIAKICHDKGVHFVLDTSGPSLKKLIQTQPFLIKPNKQELGELFDTNITDKQDVIFYAKKLVENGIKHVIVSLGGEGAILVTKDLVLSADAPEGNVVNTVGAGDSLVSGFIASYNERSDIKEAFRFGIAAGSATAFKTDLCEQKDVIDLLPQVKISTINKE